MEFMYTHQRRIPRAVYATLATAGVLCTATWGQAPALNKVATEDKPTAPQDSLGRSTPRGTVLGFLSAGRQGDFEGAAQYLNTRERGTAAAALAEQLYVVLDRRLPPTLTKLSDKPEGSQKYPAEPNQEFVGTIRTAEGGAEILLERIEHPKGVPIWLVSKETVRLVPDLYEETVNLEERLPRLFKDLRIGGVAVGEWLALILGLPLAYFVIAMLGRCLSAGARRIWRRLRPTTGQPNIDVLPGPVRLLALAALVKGWLANVSLPLLAREVWASAAAVITICSCVWVATSVTEWVERRIVSRFGRRLLGGAPLVRFVRRAVDLLLVFVGVLVALRYFGVNTTAALAGLGVGGIAVALAAQKTLENVIGGLSLIFDETIHLGDTLKLDDTIGIVEAIGLRSTRIRTLDRTVLSVPNGQVANATLENLSARDKFRFLHTVRLERATSTAQLRTVLDQITAMLSNDSRIERETVRVRFVGIAAFSLNVEIMAHVFAPGISQFLEVQQAVLLRIMEIVQEAGASIALPSQTLHVSAQVERKPQDDASLATPERARSSTAG